MQSEALNRWVNIRWPNGVVCPHCRGDKSYFFRTRKLWRCKACSKEFSVTSGTALNARKAPLEWYENIIARMVVGDSILSISGGLSHNKGTNVAANVIRAAVPGDLIGMAPENVLAFVLRPRDDR